MVTAVIPTWNRRDLLEAVLADLLAQTLPAQRIVVVDNGSADDSAEVARRYGADVISWPENRGFAQAVNAGIQAATTDWVLILNNDVGLPPDWLETMLASASRHPDAAFFAPKLVQAADTSQLDGTFDALSRSGFAWRCGAGRPDGPAWSTGRQVQFVPLTAALIRRGLFDRIGLLEEQFESYYEDVEFFLRCGLQGVTGWYEPAAVARHVGSATLGEWNKDTVFRLTRNQRRLTRLYFHELPRGPIVAGQLLWILLCLRHGGALASIRGWLAGGQTAGVPCEPAQRARIARIVEDGDAMIRLLQQESGFDWFWKAYFRLTG